MPTQSLGPGLCQLRREEGKWPSNYGKVFLKGNPDARVNTPGLDTGVLSTGVSNSGVKVPCHERCILAGTPNHPQALHAHTLQMSN